MYNAINNNQRPRRSAAYLIIYIADVLLTLSVHVEDFQEGFVDPLIRRKASLQKI